MTTTLVLRAPAWEVRNTGTPGQPQRVPETGPYEETVYEATLGQRIRVENGSSRDFEHTDADSRRLFRGYILEILTSLNGSSVRRCTVTQVGTTNSSVIVYAEANKPAMVMNTGLRVDSAAEGDCNRLTINNDGAVEFEALLSWIIGSTS